MPVYIPEYAATFSRDACQANITQPGILRLRNADLKAPPAPCITNVPLPLEPNFPPGTVAEQLRRTLADTYPLNIASHLPPGQQLGLRGFELTTPIHVHSPLAHIGTIISVPRGQIITALDAVLLLRSIITAPLDFHMVKFCQLSQGMRERVREEFLRRTGITESRVCEVVWAQFTSGDLESGGPLGIDLLLGNSEVWGFETCSVDGYSIVHVANIGSV